MPQGKFYRFCYALILIFLMIYLGTLVDFIFQPIVVLVQTLFAPIVIAGIVYYLTRPFVNMLSKWLPRSISILCLFLLATGVVTFFIILIGPELQRQFYSLVNNIPYYINEIRRMFFALQENEWFDQLLQELERREDFSWNEVTSEFANYLNQILSEIGRNIASFIGMITNIILVLIILPFILYYMLKEGEKAPNQILRLLPEKQEHEGRRILQDMDTALSSYIQGQILVSVFVGTLVYFGYLIIGLEYSLVLAVVAMLTNVIPFIGPWIGTFPGLIVGLLDSPFMALLVVIVVVIVQQVESNLISPQVMGRKLDIHPLTIILLLLVAGRFAGVLGLIFAVPTYAVLKVIVSHTYRLLELRKWSDGKR